MSRRTTVTLHDEDQQLLDQFSDNGSIEQAALRDWAKAHGIRIEESVAEAALLRMLIRVGAEALRDRTLDAGYAELALSLNSGKSAQETRRARDTYAGRTDKHVAK